MFYTFNLQLGNAIPDSDICVAFAYFVWIYTLCYSQ